mgnify:CR=1 FL=1
MTDSRALHAIDQMDAQSKKRLAFKALAEKRTNAAIDKIRILGNLSNRSAYSYTEEDIRRIFRAIEIELRGTRNRFKFQPKKRFEL